MNDRGRSPRREKDKQQQQQQSQYQTASEVGAQVQQLQQQQQQQQQRQIDEQNLELDEDQIPGGFYPYSLAAAAAAVAAGKRTPAADGSSGLLQALAKDPVVLPGTSSYGPPSPGSDSAEYEQPTIALQAYVQQHDTREHSPTEIHSVAGTLDRRLRSIRIDSAGNSLVGNSGHDGVNDDATDVEFEEEIIVPEVIYETTPSRASFTGSLGSCLIHGPRMPPDPGTSSSMSSINYDQYAGQRPNYASEVWLDHITWGMFLFILSLCRKIIIMYKKNFLTWKKVQILTSLDKYTICKFIRTVYELKCYSFNLQTLILLFRKYRR